MNIRQKKLSHKQVSYRAYLCVFQWKNIFCCCAAVISPSMIWYGVFDHILSMFRLNDQIHKFLIKKHWIVYFHLSHHLSASFTRNWIATDTCQLFLFETFSATRKIKDGQKIAKAKPFHMNDENDTKTNDLCKCIKSDGTRMGSKMNGYTWCLDQTHDTGRYVHSRKKLIYITPNSFFFLKMIQLFLVIKNVFFLTGYTTRLNILQKIYEK